MNKTFNIIIGCLFGYMIIVILIAKFVGNREKEEDEKEGEQ